MLIDISFFTKGNRQILNASTADMPSQNSVSVNEAINGYIEEYQEDFLCEMLGFTYGPDINLYLLELETDASKEHNADYDEVCNRLKKSFADYVFFHILRDSQTQATINGLVLVKSANEYVAPINRQVETWNDMVKRNKIFQEWCKSTFCPIRGIETSTNMLTPINNLNL